MAISTAKLVTGPWSLSGQELWLAPQQALQIDSGADLGQRGRLAEKASSTTLWWMPPIRPSWLSKTRKVVHNLCIWQASSQNVAKLLKWAVPAAEYSLVRNKAYSKRKGNLRIKHQRQHHQPLKQQRTIMRWSLYKMVNQIAKHLISQCFPTISMLPSQLNLNNSSATMNTVCLQIVPRIDVKLQISKAIRINMESQRMWNHPIIQSRAQGKDPALVITLKGIKRKVSSSSQSLLWIQFKVSRTYWLAVLKHKTIVSLI